MPQIAAGKIAAGTLLQVGVAAYGAYSANKQGRAMRRQSAAQANQALAERKEQQKRVDEEVANYRAMKFTNPYEGMENVFEDLRVSTQAADFQAEQGAQQRADILGQLRGAAGTSGIAGLAQSMANQGQLQARQISTQLAQQEVANERARATGAARIQQLEISGDTMVQEAQTGRQATILGMQQGQAAGANANYQQAMQNQAHAGLYASQMQNQAMQNFASTVASADFSGLGAPPPNPKTDYSKKNYLGSGDVNYNSAGELNIPGAGDYSGGFNNRIIGFDSNGQPIYG
tara:strand:- start:6 stop:872 length:867 start_codon:yes stop_codon:yes gene_type:complete